MYIVVGLGNPGDKYAHTRHNVGFDVIDVLAKDAGITTFEKKHKALEGKGMLTAPDGRIEKVVLVKPQTFMNLSGESVREVMDFYKVDPESEIIVISDDISLEVGSLRIRKKGSAGGHNGLKNIILHLGTEGFARVKVGVGDKKNGQDLVSHVLGHFHGEDKSVMEESLQRAADAVKAMIFDGPDKAMNVYNTTK